MRYQLGKNKNQVGKALKRDGSAYAGPERRRFARITLQAPVRMLIENEIECRGTVTHISPGSLTIHSTHPIGLNDNIIAYVADIDRFQGIVRRKVGRLFTMALQLSDNHREKLVETLTLELAKREGIISEEDISPERRGAQRQLSMARHSLCTLEGGVSFPCSVIDMSMTGIGIECEKILQLGQKVQIGKVTAEVIRETKKAMA